jgi:DNA-directed RNA polymerase II subunit RPB9
MAAAVEDDWENEDASENGENNMNMDDDEEEQEHVSEVPLMRFCPHDSSMLYPKESKKRIKLLYACKLCKYSEEASNNLIFANKLKKEVKNVLQTVQSTLVDDPTLPRSHNVPCGNCGNEEAVFFQSDTSDARSDSLALIFVCCNCGNKWVG